MWAFWNAPANKLETISLLQRETSNRRWVEAPQAQAHVQANGVQNEYGDGMTRRGDVNPEELDSRSGASN